MGVRFGDLVKRARAEQKIPLKRLSDRLELSIPYLSDIEHGNRNPPAPDKAREWAMMLGLDPDEVAFLALTDRRKVELAIEGERTGKVELAFSLARAWDSMTPDQERRLMGVLHEMKDE